MRGTATVLRVPVVVHVVARTPSENVDDTQILSQLDAFNRDFRRANGDAGDTPNVFASVAADCGIEFCLARRDPDGYATTGITRAGTTLANIGLGAALYTAAPAWDRDRYLNLWIAELGEYLGLSQLPETGTAANDGVVIAPAYFGTIGSVTPPFDRGRTGTHEVGHWLGLRHIWGDEPVCNADDGIADTPLQATSTDGCPVFPAQASCANGGDMFMNYMDYTDDACMNLFTLAQCARMRATLSGFRASIPDSDGCVESTVTTTSGATTSTTTTLPCPNGLAVATLASIRCRTAALAAAIDATPAFDPLRTRLDAALATTRRTGDAADSACAAGDRRTGRAQLQRTRAALARLAYLLATPAARRALDAPRRRALRNEARTLRSAARAARRTLACPPG